MITVHCMVRNEEATIAYALLSVIDQAERVLITDTGSTDRTRYWLDQIKKAYPKKVDLELRNDIPDSTDWRFHQRNPPNYSLSAIRLEMIRRTQTRFIWVLDGDEIYRDISRKQVGDLVSQWPDGKRVAYLPLLWFGQDIRSLARTDPPTYGFTGRVFVNEGLLIHGAFPGEVHTYQGEDLGPESPWAFRASWIEPFHHYEMLTKPWRRKIMGALPYSGPQPEVFARYGSNGKHR